MEAVGCLGSLQPCRGSLYRGGRDAGEVQRHCRRPGFLCGDQDGACRPHANGLSMLSAGFRLVSTVQRASFRTDSDAWSSGMDMGITLLRPDVVGLANEQGLCWADFPDTWVFRGDGMLRINGRAYPPGVEEMTRRFLETGLNTGKAPSF